MAAPSLVRPLVLAAAGASLLAASPAALASGSHRRSRSLRCGHSSSFHTTGPRARSHDRGGACHKRHSSDVPASGACVDQELSPTPEDIELVRSATFCLVNRERVDRGEQPLRPNDRLRQAAQEHTESMAFGDYFDHVSPSGQTPLSRIRAAGYIYNSQIGYEVGENIAWGTLWLSTPRAIVAAWMASPGHRANILDANYRDTGIGVSPHPPTSLARGQAGGIYTQDFGVIVTG